VTRHLARPRCARGAGRPPAWAAGCPLARASCGALSPCDLRRPAQRRSVCRRLHTASGLSVSRWPGACLPGIKGGEQGGPPSWRPLPGRDKALQRLPEASLASARGRPDGTGSLFCAPALQCPGRHQTRRLPTRQTRVSPPGLRRWSGCGLRRPRTRRAGSAGTRSVRRGRRGHWLPSLGLGLRGRPLLDTGRPALSRCCSTLASSTSFRCVRRG
jgi:hypothetical protein